MSEKNLERLIHDSKIKVVAKELLKHGFVLVSERNHLKFKAADGRIFVMSKTSSDRRTWLKLASGLKRHAGIDFSAISRRCRKVRPALAA